jgi:hypothetical protein
MVLAGKIVLTILATRGRTTCGALFSFKNYFSLPGDSSKNWQLLSNPGSQFNSVHRSARVRSSQPPQSINFSTWGLWAITLEPTLNHVRTDQWPPRQDRPFHPTIDPKTFPPISGFKQPSARINSSRFNLSDNLRLCPQLSAENGNASPSCSPCLVAKKEGELQANGYIF